MSCDFFAWGHLFLVALALLVIVEIFILFYAVNSKKFDFLQSSM